MKLLSSKDEFIISKLEFADINLLCVKSLLVKPAFLILHSFSVQSIKIDPDASVPSKYIS